MTISGYMEDFAKQMDCVCSLIERRLPILIFQNAA